MTNKFLVSGILILLLASCRKDLITPSPLPADPTSGIQYIDFENQEVKNRKPKSIDLDGDGSIDFSFSTLLVGDPVKRQDKLQFYVYSRVNTFLLGNEADESPVLKMADKITLHTQDFTWYEIAAIVLAEKVTGDEEPPYWNGLWKKADHRYLPIQIKKGTLSYLG